VLAPSIVDAAVVVVVATDIVTTGDESGAAVGGVSPHEAVAAAKARTASERFNGTRSPTVRIDRV